MSSTPTVPAQLIDEIEGALTIGMEFWETECWMRETVGRGITVEALKKQARKDGVKNVLLRKVGVEMGLKHAANRSYVYLPDQPHGWVE